MTTTQISYKDGSGVAKTALGATDGTNTITAVVLSDWSGSQITAMPVVQRNGLTLTQTTVTLTAATDTTVVAANASRKYLALAVTNTGDVNGMTFDGTAAVAGTGWPLGGASVAGKRGDGFVWEGDGVPTNAIHAISTAGTTIVVLEG